MPAVFFLLYVELDENSIEVSLWAESPAKTFDLGKTKCDDKIGRSDYDTQNLCLEQYHFCVIASFFK